MANHSSLMRQFLGDLDLAGLRRLWAHLAPHLPQPNSDADILAAAHLARTQTKTLTFDQRAYSHAWLRERGLPSMLPDHEKASAERLYPATVSAVGISVTVRDPELRPIATEIRKSMEAAVLDAHSQGRIDDAPFVRARMMEARQRTRRELYGRTGLISIGVAGCP